MRVWTPIEEMYINSTSTPFDGEPVLIKTSIGIVEAWFDWASQDWVCYDDAFTCPLESIQAWMPLPDDKRWGFREMALFQRGILSGLVLMCAIIFFAIAVTS